MIVETFEVGLLGCTCVILGDESTSEAIVVDPGGDVPRVLARLAELGLRCSSIVHTHSHFDHVSGTREMQLATDAKAMIHEADLFLFQGMQMQLDSFRVPMRAPEPGEIDRFLVDGDSVRAGSVEAGVLHTPGHTPGSLCFVIEGDRPIVCAGDTLFRGSVGRTDLWRGSAPELLDSIERKLLSLPDDTRVITGHGPETTIGFERRMNPYLA